MKHIIAVPKPKPTKNPLARSRPWAVLKAARAIRFPFPFKVLFSVRNITSAPVARTASLMQSYRPGEIAWLLDSVTAESRQTDPPVAPSGLSRANEAAVLVADQDAEELDSSSAS